MNYCTRQKSFCELKPSYKSSHILSDSLKLFIFEVECVVIDGILKLTEFFSPQSCIKSFVLQLMAFKMQWYMDIHFVVLA